MMALQDHSLNGHDDRQRFLKTGSEQMTLLSSRCQEKRSEELQAGQPHLNP